MTGDVKPWGIFATFALGAVALLAGQLSGIWDPLESTCRHASLSIL